MIIYYILKIIFSLDFQLSAIYLKKISTRPLDSRPLTCDYMDILTIITCY